MRQHSRLLPKQNASSPLDNRAPPMDGASQALDLEDIHSEMHDIVEQIRILNELNARQVQHLATNNPTLATPPVP